MFFEFNQTKVVEYGDPHIFKESIEPWLMIREAENHYLLTSLARVVVEQERERSRSTRLLVLKDGGTINAVAMVLSNGLLLLSWTTSEMLDLLVQHLCNNDIRISGTFGPEHVAMLAARKYTELTSGTFQTGRAERVFQLARLSYTLPATGKLEMATAADLDLLRPWVAGFIQETDFETKDVEAITRELISQRTLYLWKNPHPVAMAAWVLPTPRGGCINFVYTPQEFRERGFGKAVVTAVAQQALASGKLYCFILTDPNDNRTNHMYQAIGARTLCELLRCAIGSNAICEAHAPSNVAR